MTTDKDKLVVMSAEVLKEFLSHTKLTWDSAYFRFVQYSDNHRSTQWSYVQDRKLTMVPAKRLGEDFVDKYLDTLEGLMQELFLEFEKEDNKLPVVAVLKLTSNGRYNIKFDYESTNALEINLVRVGLENSYFAPEDVDIPDNIKEFQREMANAEGK